MAYNAGVTRYQKKKWMDELVTKIGAGSLKMSIHSTTTTWDATTDPSTPQVYGTTGELTSTGTGYTAGGYVLTAANLTASGNAYQLDFADQRRNHRNRHLLRLYLRHYGLQPCSGDLHHDRHSGIRWWCNDLHHPG